MNWSQKHVGVSGLVAYADLDERALDALREFNEEGALSVLQQFKESDLSHVQVRQTLLTFSVLCSTQDHVFCTQPASFTLIGCRIRALSCVG